MKKPILIYSAIIFWALACGPQPQTGNEGQTATPKATYELLGYASEEAWGDHLVTIAGCDDCHSPKMMTDAGPAVDPARRLSGHPADAVVADLDRKAIEQNGYAAANSHFTAWTGPWGISFTANLTPDETGIGNWTKESFVRALREGKFKGLENGRPLLPPMPWFNYTHMTDEEISAIFAYLKTLPAIRNVVPATVPPVSAGG